MHHTRTNLLLAMLAFLPIALLTWLGTYLIKNAARSADAAMDAVLIERLSTADHQLARDMREFTDQLDAMGAAAAGDAAVAAELGQHPWVVETWSADLDGTVHPAVTKGTDHPTRDAEAVHRVPVMLAAIKNLPANWMVRSVPRMEPFALISSDQAPAEQEGRPTVWQTSLKLGGYNLQGRMPGIANLAFPSGWHMSDGDFIYWRLHGGDRLICARFASKTLRDILFSRIPPPGLAQYPGLMMLTTGRGIHLHNWGHARGGSQGPSAASRICSPPFAQWELSYAPAQAEFPKPYLFPILLGVSSGSVLVLALAWIFFRENDRELRLAQQRVSFVNQISHELKTPLTNIRLYADMAAHRAEAAGDEGAKRHLSVVEAETARLSRLIQNVLNYARQQRDKLTVQTRDIQLDDVVERTVTHWRPLLESKSIVITLSLDGPAVMKADPDALEQILGNLLSNVDKYAAEGKAVCIRTETLAGKARLSVEDFGPGIPPGRRKSVFEPFERLRSDLNEGVSGTGIGLTISRELAELHGGTLEVCSEYRKGTRFILTLPIHTA